MKPYIYQKTGWPEFKWTSREIVVLLGKVRHLQGKLLGKMDTLGFDLKNEANLETLTLDVTKSSEIEGEFLQTEQVRSSLAKRLGINLENPVRPERDVDGVVEMLLDATQNFQSKLTKRRLFNWHASLFPTGRSGLYKINVGSWRKDNTGSVQVVSGALGKEKVHFEAPNSKYIEREMNRFLKWLDSTQELDPVIKAGIAHLWFITIHPFEDGNGRVARAITDLQLARADGISQRFYSMSSQIRKERKGYYNILEKTQQGTLDISNWLIWFLNCLTNALLASDEILQNVLFKNRFWNKYGKEINNERQKLMLNKLMDDFKGKLTTSKWAKLTKCSTDTALRDIQELTQKGILKKEKAGGRSTNYELITCIT